MINLSMEQLIEILMKIRERIAEGEQPGGYDDTTIGNKNTECTWGLCNDDPTLWDKPEYHTWPDQFSAHGRVAPNNRPIGTTCPLDTIQSERYKWSGCFYRCSFFQRRKSDRPTRLQALQLYDDAIRHYQSVEATHYAYDLLKDAKSKSSRYLYLDEDGLVTGDIRNAANYTTYDELVAAITQATDSNLGGDEGYGWSGNVSIK